MWASEVWGNRVSREFGFSDLGLLGFELVRGCELKGFEELGV